MISGRCFTNLDNYKQCEWPSVFAFPPEKGHRVRAKCGKELRVVDITHTEIELPTADLFAATAPTKIIKTISKKVPHIIVELSKW